MRVPGNRCLGWRAGAARRTILAATMVMQLASAGIAPAWAGQMIHYDRGDYTDEEWAAIEPLFTTPDDLLRDPDDDHAMSWADFILSMADLTNLEVHTTADVLDLLRHKMTLHAHLDVDRDGVKELYFWVNDPSFCGSVGCPGYLYQKVQGRWRQIAQFDVRDPTGICIRDTLSHGRPVLVFEIDALAWSGKEYRQMCIFGCPVRATEPTLADLRLREKVAAHHGCPISG